MSIWGGGPPSPPGKEKKPTGFTCEGECQKQNERLIDTTSHGWICYDCAAKLHENEIHIEFRKPTKAAVNNLRGNRW